jgi:hypothetical protein
LAKFRQQEKRVEPDWTPILLRKNFKIKGFTKFKELVWGLDSGHSINTF